MSIVESASRAPRFALDAPARVRRMGAQGWESARTVNISRSGLLVVVHASFGWRETIEAVVELSRATAGAADIRVRGRVARVAQAGGLMHLATTIDEYRLQRADASESSIPPAATDEAT